MSCDKLSLQIKHHIVKPSLPKGTRDFTPIEMNRRNRILESIQRVFRLHGYSQIETPAMENLSTLTGKYGDEGDQLLYKVLNSRIHESGKKAEMLDDFKRALDRNTNSELLTERALRYDLTVPFARFVVMHQNEIQFPFKRYQIQPVWRADRPQKGRYREFVQCDADVIGSTSLLNEAELVDMTRAVFSSLGLAVTIKINNRKILAGLAETVGAADKLIDLTIALDKLDKIGHEQVISELLAKGLSNDSIERLKPVLDFKFEDVEKTLDFLSKLLEKSEIGTKGVTEVKQVLNHCGNENIEVDITLARGLNYYTGAIFEVKSNEVQIGSIAGGGRYDDLTGVFGLNGVSGVGISFGIDRIYDVMEECHKWDESLNSKGNTRVLFVNFGEAESAYCMKAARELRESGINSEVYPDTAKMKKQMSYADDKQIPFVVLVGSEEISSGQLTLRNMVNGEQMKISLEEIIKLVQ
ncbi:MAG: histidine--tRNA ligase [Bacteroidota bacterium]